MPWPPRKPLKSSVLGPPSLAAQSRHSLGDFDVAARPVEPAIRCESTMMRWVNSRSAGLCCRLVSCAMEGQRQTARTVRRWPGGARRLVPGRVHNSSFTESSLRSSDAAQHQHNPACLARQGRPTRDSNRITVAAVRLSQSCSSCSTQYTNTVSEQVAGGVLVRIGQCRTVSGTLESDCS